MSEAGRGLIAMILACTVWGLSPLFWKQLAHIPPIEVIAHRTLWSAVTFILILAFQRRLGVLVTALRAPRMVLTMLCAALMISLNWLVYVWAVGSGQATEASLGYFLFPLVAVLAGRLFYNEKLGRAQVAAVLMAALAVSLLTFGLGVVPWIALILATSFGFYGVLKKGLDLGPVVSVTGEVALIAPFAAILIVMNPSGGGVMGQSTVDAMLLVFSGIFTATPLILFSYAARRAKLSSIGLVQYLNPTLQFFCAVVIFGEPFGVWHAVSFPMIWMALVVFAIASWRQEKARTRAASSASTSTTT